MSQGISQRSTRGLLTLLDQALSSATNFLVSFVALRTLSLEAFGSLAVAILLYGFAIKTSRALSSEPLVIHYTDAGEELDRSVIGRSAGGSFLVGVAIGLSLSMTTPFLDSSLARPLIVLAVSLPFLLVQDSYRFVFFSSGRADLASILDGLWLILAAGALGILAAGPGWSPEAIVGALAITGVVSAIVGVALTRTVPRVWASVTWLVSLRHLGLPILVEQILGIGSRQLILFFIAGYAGIDSLGAIQGARTVFGPFNVALLGFSAFVLPEVARLRDHLQAVRRLIAVAIVLLLAVIGALAIALLSIPDASSIGIFGPNWPSVEVFIVPTAIATAAMAAVAMFQAGLRGLGRTLRSLSASGFMAAMRLVLGVGATVVAGAVGGAFGLAGANLLGSLRFGYVFHTDTEASHIGAKR